MFEECYCSISFSVHIGKFLVNFSSEPTFRRTHWTAKFGDVLKLRNRIVDFGQVGLQHFRGIHFDTAHA